MNTHGILQILVQSVDEIDSIDLRGARWALIIEKEVNRHSSL
jgi:hypothetical protein